MPNIPAGVVKDPGVPNGFNPEFLDWNPEPLLPSPVFLLPSPVPKIPGKLLLPSRFGMVGFCGVDNKRRD